VLNNEDYPNAKTFSDQAIVSDYSKGSSNYYGVIVNNEGNYAVIGKGTTHLVEDDSSLDYGKNYIIFEVYNSDFELLKHIEIPYTYLKVVYFNQLSNGNYVIYLNRGKITLNEQGEKIDEEIFQDEDYLKSSQEKMERLIKKYFPKSRYEIIKDMNGKDRITIIYN